MISNTDHYIYIGGLVGFNTGRITPLLCHRQQHQQQHWQ